MSLKSDLPLRPVRRRVRQSSIVFALPTARVSRCAQREWDPSFDYVYRDGRGYRELGLDQL